MKQPEEPTALGSREWQTKIVEPPKKGESTPALGVISRDQRNYLVGGVPTPLKNISQLG